MYDTFPPRLKDYPQYCQHLAAIPHFHQFPQHLIEVRLCKELSSSISLPRV